MYHGIPLVAIIQVLSWCVDDGPSFIYCTMAHLIIHQWNYCCMNLLRRVHFQLSFPDTSQTTWFEVHLYFISFFIFFIVNTLFHFKYMNCNFLHIILNWFWILIQLAVHCLILSTRGCPKTGMFSSSFVFLLLFFMALLFPVFV